MGTGNIYRRLRWSRTAERWPGPPCGKAAGRPSQARGERRRLTLMALKIRCPFLGARINKQRRGFRRLRVRLGLRERLVLPEAQLMTAEILELKTLERETAEES